jgi:putative transposase
MGVAKFQAGAHVRIGKDEYALGRLVSDACWQLEHVSTKRIKEMEQVELSRMYADGSLAFSAAPAVKAIGKLQVQLPEGEAELIKVRRMYAEAYMKESTPRDRHDAFLKISKQLHSSDPPPSYRTVSRWARIYLLAGKDARVLARQHHGKGNRLQRFPQEVLDCCARAIDSVYLRRERGSVAEALERAIAEVIWENKLRPPEMALLKPSRRLLLRMIRRIPAFDRHVARYGRDSAMRHFRWVKGHVFAERPLARVEIDHTPLDLFVVDDNECVPLGRPYLTVAIDVFTRCILGVYIGFVPPSYLSISRALRHALLPKTSLRQEYPEIKNEWLSHGVMDELIVDNGLEFHSNSLEAVCLSIGTTIVYSPRKQPWFKPHVERFVRTVNSEIPQKIEGTTFSNIFERGDYDPVEQAVVRLSTLKRGIMRWIADVYHQRPHRSLGTTPAAMWANSISEQDIPMPDESTNFAVVMGRQYARTLTHKGIEFACLQYNSVELAELRCRLGNKLDVTISVDEEDLGHVFILDPTGERVFKVPALRQEYAGGLTAFQHDIYRKYQRAKLSELDDVDGWIIAKQEVIEMIRLDLKLTRKHAQTRKRLARFESNSLQPAVVSVVAHSQTLPSNASVQEPEQHTDLAEEYLEVDESSLRFAPIMRPRNGR